MILEEENLVEAIEDGKIVRVTEKHAKREGLPILRKSKSQEVQQNLTTLPPGSALKKIKEENRRPLLDQMYRPKDWKEKQVSSELIDNFHWYIRTERKKRGLTRKQLGKLINESENNLQMIEAGFLPSSDFVLINKLQNEFKINLRRDQKDFSKPINQMIASSATKQEIKKSPFTEKFSGSEIEILDD